MQVLKAHSVRVFGRVQRVGYRRFVLDVAQELGVLGFIRNELDGSVSIFVQGEERLVGSFLERIRPPPPPVNIREVKLEEARPQPKLKSFQIKYGELADELQEGLGAMQAVFTDYWGEFHDLRQEFRDFRELSLRLSGEILDEVRSLRMDLRVALDERLARLEMDVAEIRAKLGLGDS